MFFLAWRNVARRFGQSAVTVAIISLAIALCTAGVVLFSSLDRGLKLAEERLGADIIVLPSDVGIGAQEALFTAEPANIYLPANTVERVEGIAGVEKASPQFFTQTLNESCCSVLGVTRIVGIDAATDFTITPWVEGGLPNGLADGEILLGARASEVTGGKASILGNQFSVKARLAETGSSVDETIFMDMEVARRIASESPYLEGVWKDADPYTSISAVMVKTTVEGDAQAVADAINEACPFAAATAVSGLVKNTSEQLSLFGSLFAALVAVVAVMAALALGGRFSALAKDRRKEIGLMRAVGFSSRSVVGSILLEAGIVSAAGGLAGVCAGCIAAAALSGRMHEVLALPGGGIDAVGLLCAALAGMAFALGLGLASSSATAVRYARMDPKDALRKGDL